MPDYTEEIYQRAENRYITDTAKQNWLNGFNAGMGDRDELSEYELQGIQVADAFRNAKELKTRLREAKTVQELDGIIDDANNESVPYYVNEYNIIDDATFKRDAQLEKDKKEFDDLQKAKDNREKEIRKLFEEDMRERDKEKIRKIDETKSEDET